MSIMNYFPILLNGIYTTVILMLASLSVGLILSLLLVVGSLSNHFILKFIIRMFIFFIRGTPLLVQLFLIYYGVAQFEWFRHSIFWFAFRSPMFCAIIALAINTACYTTVLLLGAIHSIPKNEITAAEAIGMSKWLIVRRIMLPRAFRIMLPAYSNEVIMILKSTSLASTITLMDIMGVTQQLISQTYDTGTFYAIGGILYLILNAIIIMLFRMFERRWRVTLM